MPHMTHNYLLGLVALVVSFIVCFYVPLTYAWVKIRAQQIRRSADDDGRAVCRAAQAVVRRDGIDPDIPRDEQCEAAPEQRRDGIMRQKRPVARQRGVKSVHPAAPCSQ